MSARVFVEQRLNNRTKHTTDVAAYAEIHYFEISAVSFKLPGQNSFSSLLRNSVILRLIRVTSTVCELVED
mgnify:CR=1 FL=1